MSKSLSQCSVCDGFNPLAGTTCVHCDAALATTDRKKQSRVARFALGTLASVTLMACYGGPRAGQEPQKAPSADKTSDAPTTDADTKTPEVKKPEAK